MHWININIDALQSMEYKRSNPTKRATWLSLLGYCCQHETGGRITGCRDWSDREWLQVCGVTKEEVLTDSLLCTFDGDDLLVAFYPLSQEQAIRAKREAGKKGGRPRKLDAPQTPELQAKEPYGLPDGSDSFKRKEKEGKGKEGKEKNTLSDDAPPAEDGVLELIEEVDTPPAKPKTPKKKAFVPPSREEFIAYAVETIPKRNPDWNKDQAERCADLQFDTYVDQTWHDGNGAKISNWKNKSIATMLYKKPESFGRDPRFFADQRKLAADQANACG